MALPRSTSVMSALTIVAFQWRRYLDRRVAAEEAYNPRLPWIGLAHAAHLVDLGQEAHRVARVLYHLVAQRLTFLGGQRLAGE